MIDDPIRDWQVQTVTSLLSSVLHRYTASHANPGSDKWTQFPFIYLSVVWSTEHMLLCPPINLYPVNTTPIYRHISPPEQHGLIKHAVTQRVKNINTLPVKLLANPHQADNYKIAADTSDLTYSHMRIQIMKTTLQTLNNSREQNRRDTLRKQI